MSGFEERTGNLARRAQAILRDVQGRHPGLEIELVDDESVAERECPAVEFKVKADKTKTKKIKSAVRMLKRELAKLDVGTPKVMCSPESTNVLLSTTKPTVMRSPMLAKTIAKLVEAGHEDLAEELLGTDRAEASLAGTYADFMYGGEETFLKEASKFVSKIAKGKAESLRVIRNSGRAPFLNYEGEDKGDMPMEFTAHLIITSDNDVTLSTFGTTWRGSFDNKVKFKWGRLTPKHVADAFTDVFGR